MTDKTYGPNLCDNCGVFGRVETKVNPYGANKAICYVTCHKCGRTGESAGTRQWAINNWNSGLISYQGKKES
jgi:hypothetical protein